jgi:hypothetical protein
MALTGISMGNCESESDPNRGVQKSVRRTLEAFQITRNMLGIRVIG